jgi:hypothetical protein
MNKIDATTLYRLIMAYGDKEVNGWKVEQKTLTSSDVEDGGGHYDLVLKHLESEKYYLTRYCDWDIENTDVNWEDETVIEEGRCDLRCSLTEVVPKERTIIEYVKV